MYHENNTNKFERRRDARLSVEDLKDVSVESFIDIAKDKWKSRSLQRSLMESDEVVAKLIYTKAEPIFTQLLSDQYGNYLSQKILEYCSDQQFDLLFSKVEGKLSNLANEVHGTRAVQKFVEEGVKRKRTENILKALRDHVEPLSRSVTGFHVVVKLLEKLSREDVDEILQRLCHDAAAVVSMGKDQWGCCVLKACIDTAEQERLQVIVDAIVNHTLELVQDPYGNYVVQHVLASSSCFMPVLPQMIAALKDHVLDLCQQKFSSNVLEKLLTTAPEPHKQILIQGVLTAGKLETSEVAQHLLFHQYGNYVLQQTLAVAKEPQHSILLEAVRPYVHQVLRHLFEGDHTTPAVPNHGSTSLAPEQAQRLAMKLVKRFPGLLEGLEEHEKAMLSGPSSSIWAGEESLAFGQVPTAYDAASAGWGGADPYGAFPFGSPQQNPYYAAAAAAGGMAPTFWNQSYPYSAMAQWAQYSQLLALGQAAAGQAAGKFGNVKGLKGFGGGGKTHHQPKGGYGKGFGKGGGKGGFAGFGGKNYYYNAAMNAQKALAHMQSSPISSTGMPGTPGIPPELTTAQSFMTKQGSSPWASTCVDYDSSFSASSPDSIIPTDDVARIVGFWPNYQISYEDQVGV